MKVVMIVGFSKTGKTTSAEAVVKQLIKKGYTVGAAKDIHRENFTLETEGADTDRYKKAGADPVTARGTIETGVMFSGQMDPEKMLDMYNQDWVILEGDCGANCPVIVCGKTSEDVERKMNDRVIAVSGIIANNIQQYEADDGRILPVFNAVENADALADLLIDVVPERMSNFGTDKCHACGQKGCKGLLADIIAGKRDRHECINEKEDVSLYFDGREVAMVGFVKDVIRGSVEGMVSQLKGYSKESEITIKIK